MKKLSYKRFRGISRAVQKHKIRLGKGEENSFVVTALKDWRSAVFLKLQKCAGVTKSEFVHSLLSFQSVPLLLAEMALKRRAPGNR